MGIQVITSFLIYTVISAFTPGPGNILALNTMVNHGWKKGKPLFLGIFFGYFFVQRIVYLKSIKIIPIVMINYFKIFLIF